MEEKKKIIRKKANKCLSPTNLAHIVFTGNLLFPFSLIGRKGIRRNTNTWNNLKSRKKTCFPFSLPPLM